MASLPLLHGPDPNHLAVAFKLEIEHVFENPTHVICHYATVLHRISTTFPHVLLAFWRGVDMGWGTARKKSDTFQIVGQDRPLRPKLTHYPGPRWRGSRRALSRPSARG